MTNRVKVLAVVLCATALLAGLAGCKNEDKTDENTANSISVNNAELDGVVQNFINGALAPNSYFDAAVSINSNDIHTNINFIDKYLSEDAMYYKIQDLSNSNYYLYRFQINQANQFSSYIIYELEA